MQLNSEIAELPEDDRFLPRYLTVQLLAVLDKSIPTADDTVKVNAFVENSRHKEFFSPVTYSIFWRENVNIVLKDNPDEIDTLDRYNRAPLTIALANEDFRLATRLVEMGANIYLEDKLVLEISLMSMLQRDATLVDKILLVANDDDKPWIKEYLDYVHGYAIGKPIETKQDRDVLDPPIRHFGQILDTLVYFNGIPSYYGFISPSLKILKDHLNNYAETEQFAPIAKAFSSTVQACAYRGNLPTITNAAEALTEQIQNNLANSGVDPTVLFGGWAGNAVAIAFINNTFILSNLGTAGDLKHGTMIYNVRNPKAITKEFVDLFIRGLGTAANPNVVLAAIGEIVDATPIYQIKQALNPIDNCIFVNPRIIIEGLMLVLSAYQKHGGASKENLAALSGRTSSAYKDYLDSLYQVSTRDLARFMRNDELLQNKRLECCSLALEYINQHFRDPNALQRCIELKNALEFVGLKDFYQRSILPEAQEAIQKQMIRDQETTAVQVIEQEYALISKQS